MSLPLRIDALRRHIMRSPLLRRLLVVGSTLWVAGACAVVVAGLSTRARPADLILVLGNAVDSASRPLPGLEARLEAALRLYQSGGYGAVMVSGGIDPTDGRNEALGMRDWLVANGVPATRVVMDLLGDNTRASAEHAQAWLSLHGLKTVATVSQYFHLPRARLALRQAGAEDAGGSYPRRWFVRDIYSSLREVPGCLAYWARWN